MQVFGITALSLSYLGFYLFIFMIYQDWKMIFYYLLCYYDRINILNEKPLPKI